MQTDIYVRFLRSCGKDVIYICADDTHGTPIELNARKQGVAPEEFIDAMRRRAPAPTSRDFDIDFDPFDSTQLAGEPAATRERIYGALKAARRHRRAATSSRSTARWTSAFCPTASSAAPAPSARRTDQYGDACENCGSTYDAHRAEEPALRRLRHATECGRSSAHLLLQAVETRDFLREWIAAPGPLQPEIANQLERLLREGPARLGHLAATRPYFGFDIPGETDKFFYVWLDAPIGYISSTDHWCAGARRGRASSGARTPTASVVHFIGKDIVYFHTLFWPAMLHAAGWKVPARVHVHGHARPWKARR